MKGQKRVRARDGSRLRRTGVVAVALLSGTAAVTLVLAREYHLGVAAALVVILAGLPGLYLAWAAYSAGQRDSAQGDGLSLAEVADQLAAGTGAQWSSEAAVRRLNDPYPLPVSWRAADASLADSWDVQVRLATSGHGWPPHPPPGAWASSADDLAGSGRDLAGMLARIPAGRLVVLGEPGAGKTMLMVGLVLDLLAARPSGGAVPVLVSLASWNPEGQDLHDWLSAELTVSYPALGAAAPAGAGGGTRISALLKAGLILPILDGLDEVPGAVRGSAITKINDALRPGQKLVLTCRTEQYKLPVRPLTAARATVRAAAVIQLCPLDAVAISRYLRDDAGDEVAAARWDPVVASLATQAPAAQALVTPLMVGLARTIYNPRVGESAGELRDPAELCSPALADRTAVEAHLFDAYIPAAYRNAPAGRWTALKAGPWLTFLAGHLECTTRSPDLAWWQLQEAAPAVIARAAGLACGLATALVFGLVYGFAGGAAFGLVLGLGNGLAGWIVFAVADGFAVITHRVTRPSRGVRVRRDPLLYGVAVGLVYGLGAGLLTGSTGGLGIGTGLGYGLLFGLVLGLVYGLVVGLRGVPGDLTAGASPRASLRQDRRSVPALGLVAGLTVGLVLWFAGGFLAGLTGFTLGLILGSGKSMMDTAWPSYTVARYWLALHHQLPWHLMSFLADAHRRGVLRQAGAIYQFRHIELQHRLAGRH